MRIHKPKRAGAALIEFVFVVPIAFLFIFAILEYARFVMVHELLNNAAREGARYAVVATDDDSVTSSTIVDYVDDRMGGQQKAVTGYSVTVYHADPATGADLGDWKNAGFGESIAVTITGQYPTLIPWFTLMPPTVDVNVTSMMTSEAN